MAQLFQVRLFFTLLLFASLLHAEFEYGVENTNNTIVQGSINPSSDAEYIYNYDRLRVRLDYTQGEYFSTFIGDIVNYVGKSYVASKDFEYVKLLASDTPFKTQSSFYDYTYGNVYLRAYRAYSGYENASNRVVVGLQNISMGVGHIWNPSNLFNPKNIYALEPDEVFGVFGALYTRHLSDLSDLSLVVSQKKDKTLKYALSYKAYLDFADMGLNVISSDDTKMLSADMEGNLADTGIELRSEVVYINSQINQPLAGKKDVEMMQGIVGADYAFVDGLTVTGELLYSSEKFSYSEILSNYDADVASNLFFSHFYSALSCTYSVNIFLDTSLTYIESFNTKNSRFISPTLTYTLNDYNAFNLGAMIQSGASGSEFGDFKNSYYLKWTLSF